MVPNRTDLDGTMYEIYQWYQIELDLDGTMTMQCRVRDISWYQMALDLDGTIPRPRWDYIRDISWYQLDLDLDGTIKRYIMVPNGTGPRWDYVQDISMVPNRPRPRWDYIRDMVPNRPRPRWDYVTSYRTIYICAVQDISMVPNRPRPRWDYIRDISWYQIDLDLDGTMYEIYQWYQIELDLNGTMTIYICANSTSMGLCKRYIIAPNMNGSAWDYIITSSSFLSMKPYLYVLEITTRIEM
ncbi:hypothetical protein BDR07DRAFT_1382350 [Suillus spraguei]|nr:hypothetical protein BDR07DRAFT_1382350 [Suillus spraguei]